MKVDKIYVLAIRHTQEKIDSIKERLVQLDTDGVTPYEIIIGHDGWNDSLPDDVKVYRGWAIPESWNDFWKLPVQPGEIGCTLSHISAWRKILEDGVKTALILEEDFIPVRSIKSMPPPDKTWPFNWDYLTLGRYVFDGAHDIKLDENYCIPSLHYNMHAYMLTDQASFKLLSYNLHKNIIPVDEFMPVTYIDHRRPDINFIWPLKQIIPLATNELYVSQSSDADTTTVSGHTKTFENRDRTSNHG